MQEPIPPPISSTVLSSSPATLDPSSILSLLSSTKNAIILFPLLNLVLTSPSPTPALVTRTAILIDIVLHYITCHTPSPASIVANYFGSSLAPHLLPFLTSALTYIVAPPPDSASDATYDAKSQLLSLLIRLVSIDVLYQPTYTTTSERRATLPSVPPLLHTLFHQIPPTLAHAFATSTLALFLDPPRPPPNSGAALHTSRLRLLFQTHQAEPPPAVHTLSPTFLVAEQYQHPIHATLLPTVTPQSLVATTIAISSSLVALPFRLLALLLSSYPSATTSLPPHTIATPPNNVIKISPSILADLQVALFLSLCHLRRGPATPNAFYDALRTLDNERPTLSSTLSPGASFGDAAEEEGFVNSSLNLAQLHTTSSLTCSFERLFATFAATVHDEQSCLLMYTAMQASASFTSLVTARSDLDLLVLPLLQNVYAASQPRYKRRPGGYRNPRQLYLIMIVLLKFSQDYAFAENAFERITLAPAATAFYEERSLTNINLGSLMFLSLIRCVTHNLNRSRDAYLLENSLAVLHNLSPHIKSIHAYTATRLVSFLVSATRATRKQADSAMAREAAEGAARSIDAALHGDRIRSNVQLVYALVHRQRDIEEALGMRESCDEMPLARIRAVLAAVDGWFDATGSSAEQILAELDARVGEIALKVRQQEASPVTSFSASVGAASVFSYTEDEDSEVFFVPYCLEVIVENTTANCISFEPYDNIKLFDVEQRQAPTQAEVDVPATATPGIYVEVSNV